MTVAGTSLIVAGQRVRYATMACVSDRERGIDVDEIVLMKDLTDQERLMFQSEMAANRKDPTVGVLLALFPGGLGAHRFYMGQTGLGFLYLCFCWMFIPPSSPLWSASSSQVGSGRTIRPSLDNLTG